MITQDSSGELSIFPLHEELFAAHSLLFPPSVPSPRSRRSLEFAFPYEEEETKEIFVGSVQFLEVLRRNSGLQHLVVEARRIHFIPPSRSSTPGGTAYTRSHSVDHVQITPVVVSAILNHPSLRTFAFGAFPSSWIPNSTPFTSTSSSQRTRPLLISYLDLQTQAGEPFEPLLRFIAERGIHVRTLDLNQLSPLRLHHLRSFLALPLPTLEVLRLDFGYDQPAEFPLPQDLFLPLLENHPSLRTVVYVGEDEWIGRAIWSLLGTIPRLEPLATFELDPWWKARDFCGFEISFVKRLDGSLRFEELSLAMAFGDSRPPLDSFLHDVDASFPDLKSLRLGGCSSALPKVSSTGFVFD